MTAEEIISASVCGAFVGLYLIARIAMVRHVLGRCTSGWSLEWKLIQLFNLGQS